MLEVDPSEERVDSGENVTLECVVPEDIQLTDITWIRLTSEVRALLESYGSSCEFSTGGDNASVSSGMSDSGSGSASGSISGSASGSPSGSIRVVVVGRSPEVGVAVLVGRSPEVGVAVLVGRSLEAVLAE